MADYNVKVRGMKVIVENTPANIAAYQALKSALDTLFGPDQEGKAKKLRAYQVIEKTVTVDGDEVVI